MREPFSANGTETQTNWNAINWRKANRTERNLRQRLFRATQEDNLVIKTPAARGKMVDDLAHYSPWKAKPARRVYIPKANHKLRPLGIPVVIDRCLQAMIKNALEPTWEAKFEGTSYGFRPGRSCHDAIGKIYELARPNKTKKWILDADIKSAFDNISHDFLL